MTFQLESRARRLERLGRGGFEVVVVGGGITGAGCALDLALRGVRVLLVERGDWAGATSSASSRLVHGGLRYLEQLEIGLVRESCLERDLLLTNAGGLVWPERFTFPVRRGDRVGLLRMRIGLWLYTLLSLPRALGRPRGLSRAETARILPGIDTTGLRGAGAYRDAATDDARLTLAVVLSAARAGACVISRCEVEEIANGDDGAFIRFRDTETGNASDTTARAAVLAAGPFTDRLRERAGLPGGWIAATRGAHVVVPRDRLSTDGAVIFPSTIDGRIMFLIPWPRSTVVGTTDLDADPSRPVRATPEEVRYLLDSANGLVPSAALTPDDVISTWAGLRPLLAGSAEDPSARSREERVARERSIYTIAGGKLTGYRAMAERLAARLAADLGLGRGGRRSPTREHRLLGAGPRITARPAWSSLPAAGPRSRAEVLLARYGALAGEVEASLGEAAGGAASLGDEVWSGEIDWAVEREDARGVADFLLRRTDVGRGPPWMAAALGERVEARMAELCGWDAPRRAREGDAWRREVADLHAWRNEDLP